MISVRGVSRALARRAAASTHRRRRGTTLLELVVALAVTGVVALVGAQTFETLIDRREQVVRASEATEREGARRALVREWVLSGTIDPPLVTATLRSAVANQAARTRAPMTVAQRLAQSVTDEFMVTTSAATPLGHRDVQVRLYIDADPDTPERGLSAEYRAFAFAPAVRQELDGDVQTLRVEWLDATTRRWRPASEVLTSRVQAVRLAFGETADAPRLRTLPLTFVLPVSANPTGDQAEDIAR